MRISVSDFVPTRHTSVSVPGLSTPEHFERIDLVFVCFGTNALDSTVPMSVIPVLRTGTCTEYDKSSNSICTRAQRCQDPNPPRVHRFLPYLDIRQRWQLRLDILQPCWQASDVDWRPVLRALGLNGARHCDGVKLGVNPRLMGALRTISGARQHRRSHTHANGANKKEHDMWVCQINKKSSTVDAGVRQRRCINTQQR